MSLQGPSAEGSLAGLGVHAHESLFRRLGLKRLTRSLLLFGGAAALGAGAAWFWLNSELRPMPEGKPFYIRYAQGATLDQALSDLQKRGVVRNPWASKLVMRLRGGPSSVLSGSYEFRPGMGLSSVTKALNSPIRQMVRVPEGWWIARVATRLEARNVCDAEEYIRLAADPARFQSAVSFPLPKGSLEGYLYPDTYDLPPLLGAEEVIRRQLKAFEEKIYKKLPPKADLQRALIIGSIIELEAGLDKERPVIAGVIENRLKKRMRLEMDASVLYGIQEWRVLKPGEVRKLVSPYNTYLINGLPPGPIGSPSDKSVMAALSPASHGYLFYVARPTREHFFTTNYADHIRRIRQARKEFRDAEAKKKAEESAK